MPVVLVSGAPLESDDATREVLLAVNTAIATGLGLQPADVYASFAATPVAMLGTDPVAPWPVALVHGSAREPERMSAALDRVRTVLSETWDCPPGAVWAQWVVPD